MARHGSGAWFRQEVHAFATDGGWTPDLGYIFPLDVSQLEKLVDIHETALEHHKERDLLAPCYSPSRNLRDFLHAANDLFEVFGAPGSDEFFQPFSRGDEGEYVLPRGSVPTAVDGLQIGVWLKKNDLSREHVILSSLAARMNELFDPIQSCYGRLVQEISFEAVTEQYEPERFLLITPTYDSDLEDAYAGILFEKGADDTGFYGGYVPMQIDGRTFETQTEILLTAFPEGTPPTAVYRASPSAKNYSSLQTVGELFFHEVVSPALQVPEGSDRWLEEMIHRLTPGADPSEGTIGIDMNRLQHFVSVLGVCVNYAQNHDLVEPYLGIVESLSEFLVTTDSLLDGYDSDSSVPEGIFTQTYEGDEYFVFSEGFRVLEGFYLSLGIPVEHIAPCHGVIKGLRDTVDSFHTSLVSQYETILSEVSFDQHMDSTDSQHYALVAPVVGNNGLEYALVPFAVVFDEGEVDGSDAGCYYPGAHTLYSDLGVALSQAKTTFPNAAIYVANGNTHEYDLRRTVMPTFFREVVQRRLESMGSE
jgi:hypothetical protein